MSTSKPSPPWRLNQKLSRHIDSSSSHQNLLPNPTHRSPFHYPTSSPSPRHIRKLGPLDCSVEPPASTQATFSCLEMGWSFRKQLEELDRLGKEETDEESLMSEDEPTSVSLPSRSRAHTSRRSSAIPASASSSKQPLLHSSRSSPRLRMGESRSRPQLDASREGSQSPNYYASTVRRRSMTTVSPHSCAETRRGSSRSPSGDSDISSSPAQVVDADFAAVNQMENFDSFRRPSPSASVPKTVSAEKASPFRDSSPTTSKTSLSSILNPVPAMPSAESRSQTSSRKTLMISNSSRSPRRSAPYPSRLKHQKLNSSYHGHCPPCQSLREHYRVGICY